VLAKVIKSSALPKALRQNEPLVVKLGELYKQLNALAGTFGLDTLEVSTKALASNSSNDSGKDPRRRAAGPVRVIRNGPATRLPMAGSGRERAGRRFPLVNSAR
jgi:hypothetical protein